MKPIGISDSYNLNDCDTKISVQLRKTSHCTQAPSGHVNHQPLAFIYVCKYNIYAALFKLRIL